jgi:hypothetical protein
MRAATAAVALTVAMVGCGTCGGSGTPRKPSDRSNGSPLATSSDPVDSTDDTGHAPSKDEVTAGPVTILTNEYGLPDTSGWDTTVVFDLTNHGGETIAVPYRVKVESEDGQTKATSDGTDTVLLAGGETVTVVLDGLDPTGPTAPTKATVTVYGRTGPPASAWIGAPDWTSANEDFDCDNGLVGCGFTGDLTYDGPDIGSPSRIQIVAYKGDEIVAAGHPTTEVTDVASGETIPYAGQIASADGFDGTGVTSVRVWVEQTAEGD